MICFPNAKINIGLEVIRKREDNYHDLETVFYPVPLSDILEMIPSTRTHLTITGLDINDTPGDNLVLKAYHLLKDTYDLPPVEFHLHKIIPAGAGLGGGSSDAAFTLTGLNDLFQLNIEKQTLLEYSSRLGSDCAFFILNYPVFAEGKGNIFSNIEMNLRDYFLVLVKPSFAVSTAQAYGGIKPSIPDISLLQAIKNPATYWKDQIYNQFEKTVFNLFPEIEEIKKSLYNNGAIYASMSGSGSTVYGLFKEVPQNLSLQFPEYFYWEGKCQF